MVERRHSAERSPGRNVIGYSQFTGVSDGGSVTLISTLLFSLRSNLHALRAANKDYPRKHNACLPVLCIRYVSKCALP